MYSRSYRAHEMFCFTIAMRGDTADYCIFIFYVRIMFQKELKVIIYDIYY